MRSRAARYAAENLDDRHPHDVFIQVSVDPRQPDTDGPVGLAGAHPEALRGPEDQREDGERDQGQTPVHVEHDDHDADEHEEVAEHRYNPGGDEFVQRVHVVGDPRDQSAHRVAVVEADG